MRLLNTTWTPTAGSLELDQEYATELGRPGAGRDRPYHAGAPDDDRRRLIRG